MAALVAVVAALSAAPAAAEPEVRPDHVGIGGEWHFGDERKARREAARRMLRRLGYQPGRQLRQSGAAVRWPPIGRNLEAALYRFQIDQGLNATGQLSTATLIALRREVRA